ncbi:hypothetical protein [Dickeya oryzae]
MSDKTSNKAKHKRPMQKAALGWTSLSLGLCWRRQASERDMDIRKIFEAISLELSAKFQKTIQIKHNGGKRD